LVRTGGDGGLTDFDVIGLSYYPQWSSFTPAELGSAVQTLSTSSGKDVLIVETGYPWTADDAGDTADNVLDLPLRGYGLSPQGQGQFMADVTSIVVANGGLGTVYWEPAWLSTACRTRWGQGSHWENATLFDFEGSLHAGADYLGAEYDPLDVPDGAPSVAIDATGDTDDPDADLTEITAVGDGSVAITATVDGEVHRWPGAVILAIDIEEGAGGDGGRRPYDFADDDRPELLLESSWNDDPGAGYVTTSMSTWQEGEWTTATFTGRVDIELGPGGGSTVTWVFPDGSVDPAAEVTVMTARRGRAGALADVVDPGTPDAAVAMTLAIGVSR
jgi:Glycosyl hydrolase family 53